jgi:hypothetical protein
METTSNGTDVPKNAEGLKATKTITLIPEVIATKSAPNTETTILPFHLTVTEYCSGGKKSVKAKYKSGGILADMDLPPGQIIAIAHQVPKFPPFQIGTYDYNTSRLRFGYFSGPIQCEWFDDETWKQCGECRAGLWSGAPIECGAGGSRVSLHTRVVCDIY